MRRWLPLTLVALGCGREHANTSVSFRGFDAYVDQRLSMRWVDGDNEFIQSNLGP